MFGFFKKNNADTKKDSVLPPLRLHNTLSGNTEVFMPLNEREVKMYNCGPTVYGTQHIGNMRAAVFADTLRRTLLVWRYNVKQAINITDFGHLASDADEGEDKMTTGLKREGMALTLENMRTLATKYMEEYFADIETLGVDRTKIIFPRASDYIQEQIALIQTLEQKGYAYQTKSGVYFDTAKFAQYGKLGGINLGGQKDGARVEENKEKKNPIDFVLWKGSKKIGWESPWGRGFPGWHIECTAMIFSLLGKQIDIHTGGIEHIPVHHNNELAQAEAASGKQFVRYWLHNDHITIEGKKISKSLGNTVFLHNVIDKGFSARALRYWFLTAHYRSSANFTWDALAGADTTLTKLQRFFLSLPTAPEAADPSFMADFYAAIADDLKTPVAVARIWELVKNPSVSPGAKHASLLLADAVLGLGLSDKKNTAKLMVTAALPEAVQALVTQREDARKAKDFARSDLLRQDIADQGYMVSDTDAGPVVSKKDNNIGSV